ncbi:hypothetical protein [Gordonia terrae]|uniref:SCP2 domain-containing protein n=2 Tax=Gordonia terrae TaxID=2055 RepID=A0AAD0NVS3_9ACTN|nr:hypothetical protein [Gordonia terrae]VTR01821.1 Uncharacterised protein [Clostridioides difficile]ANY23574.1 hypothetical protein BCM27_12900 [Gordonia terrae]AWO84306.1 hypothetical protein DLJ61_13000 [Gordonia terrae]VTS52851.1 Uncharacterised protein [Gordonia terrae]GAB42665.1 hypothetical protein GOTRE_021_00120 [Gordonia terrae NBRC 100016]
MEITTLSAAGVASAIRIEIDDDATPIVRLLGRILRDASRTGHAADVLGRGSGSVAIRSHSTPQAATVTFADGMIAVTGGVFAPVDATVVVDLDSRCARVYTEGDADLADAVLGALQVPLPDWQEAGARFWEQTRTIPGMPDALAVVARGIEGSQEARFGGGDVAYRIVGSVDTLAGFFTGTDFLFTALERGLRVQGSLAQLSVMTAASWKARYDV